MTLDQYVRIYKVACVTALADMVGMDGTPDGPQLNASIEAGVAAVLKAAGVESTGAEEPRRDLQ